MYCLNMSRSMVGSFFRKIAVRFTQWFDSDYKTGQVEMARKPRRVDWLRVIPFVAIHLGCFAVIWVGWSWTAVGVAMGLYLLRMFAITGFFHRYFSHRSFKTSRAMQFLFALAGG